MPAGGAFVPGRLVECIPNISEGRRAEVIEAVADAVRNTASARLLNVQSDQSHNRSVIDRKSVV